MKTSAIAAARSVSRPGLRERVAVMDGVGRDIEAAADCVARDVVSYPDCDERRLARVDRRSATQANFSTSRTTVRQLRVVAGASNQRSSSALGEPDEEPM